MNKMFCLSVIFFLLFGCRGGSDSNHNTIQDLDKTDGLDSDDMQPDEDYDSESFDDLCDGIAFKREGNEVCPSLTAFDYQNWTIQSGCDYQDNEMRKEYSFIIDRIKHIDHEVYHETMLIGHPTGKYNPKASRCSIVFVNYPSELFTEEKLIGKKLKVSKRYGFYGSPEGEYVSRDFTVIRDEAEALFSVYAKNVTDTATDRTGDVSVWPSPLVPEIKSKQVVPENCMPTHCYMDNKNPEDPPSVQIGYAAPVEFNHNGEKVLVRSTKLVEKNGFIYVVKGSALVHPLDTDQIFPSGKKFHYDFYIINRNSLQKAPHF